MPGVVWEAWGRPDAAGQRINFISEHVEVMLGYSVEEWLSTPNFWLTIVHPEDRERAARGAAAVYEGGRSQGSQFRWIAKDGRVLWVLAHSIVVRDEHGQPLGMRGITVDVTERKQLEVEQAERARLDGALLVTRTMAHDINNALSPITGFAELLLRTPAVVSDPTATSFVDSINTAVDEAAEKVRRLQRITRLEAVESPLGPDRPVLDVERSIQPKPGHSDGPTA